MARSEADGVSRALIWREHPDGRVSAHQFFYSDANGGVEVNTEGIFAMALRKGYKLPVPDLLLGQLYEGVQLDGPVFENLSALLALCEMPLNVERLPMYSDGPVSTSP